MAATLIVVLALSACTDDDPVPVEPPAAEEPDDVATVAVGRDVAVILPTRGGADEAYLASLRAQFIDADQLLGDGVETVATYVPASPAFIGDLARSFAERGVDVVCVIGPDAVEQLQPLIDRFPAVEFCAIDGRPLSDDDPDGLRRVVLRTEELGHTVGVAARLEAGDEGIVGLVLGEGVSGPDRFRSGLLAGLGDIEVVEADVPDGVDATPTERLEAVLAAGATHIVVDETRGMTAAVAAIDGRAAVLGPEEVLMAAGLAVDVAGSGDTVVVADWRFHWLRTLVGPVGALGDDGLRPRSLGLVALATMRMGPSTSATTREQVQRVRAAFGRGERDPLEPALEPPIPPSTPPAPDAADPEPGADGDGSPDGDAGADAAADEGEDTGGDPSGAADGGTADDRSG